MWEWFTDVYFRIISGAPRGRYPGGLPLPLDWRVCQEYQSSNCASHQALLMNYTQEQILSCYNNITTGLVYKCPLGPGGCNELSGNGNALSSDGKLFDSIGKLIEMVNLIMISFLHF